MMRFLTIASLAIHLQPSARNEAIHGIRDGVVTVRVTALAIEGRANEAVRRLVAKRLGVARSSVTIVRGHRSRHKVVEIDGLDRPVVLDALTP
jgi:uncharacterized protein (TIGR00251 family)